MSINPDIHAAANKLLDFLFEEATLQHLIGIRDGKTHAVAQYMLNPQSIEQSPEDQLWSVAAELLSAEITIIKSEKSPKVKVIESIIKEILSPGKYNLMDIFSQFEEDFRNEELITVVSGKLRDIISWLPRSKIEDLGNRNIQQFFGSTKFGTLTPDKESTLWKCVARRLDVNIADSLISPRDIRCALAAELLKRQPKQTQE